jgi:hypothetical protein
VGYSILWLLPGVIVTAVFGVMVFFPVPRKAVTTVDELYGEWAKYLDRSRRTINVGVLAVVLLTVGWLIAVVTAWM